MATATATFGAAAVLGRVVGIRARAHSILEAAFAALVVQGVAMMATGIPHQVALLAAMTVIGMTAGVASVWLSAIFQQTIDPAYLGRVSSLTQLGDLLLVPVAIPAYGALAARTDPTAAAALFGAAMTAMGLAVAVRHVTRRV